jgi:hypothetical protein
MATEKRRAPPGWSGAPSGDDVEFAGFDISRVTHPAFQSQASLRRRDFARAVVFEEFGYRHARAIDYDGFVDRKPNQAPRAAP